MNIATDNINLSVIKVKDVPSIPFCHELHFLMQLWGKIGEV